ncbi:MAG: universal stress protein [Planctomycetes bacterium]|nr:universal stress protein [Planctomycetota bacterium]
MGTHGRTLLRRSLMGSVAEAVTRRAGCPVATVRSSVPVPAEAVPAAGVPNAELGGGDPVREVVIPVGPVALRGTLRWTGKPRGVVVFAHGSGSGRHSPRNQFVGGVLVGAGFATLLVDLLTAEEGEDRAKVFDVELLAGRLAAAAKWVAAEPEMVGAPVGYFGASTGSAAALIAAAAHPERVAAVVSRGGRPDLARNDLPAVKAPTLLIVGGDDEPVLTWNQSAFERLKCLKELIVVPGAAHLLEEPGALENVAELARDWFERHLSEEKKAAG